MVEELKYPDDVQKVIDERIKKRKFNQYGNWTRIEGLLEEMPQSLIDDAKSLIYENAEESLKEVGVELKDQHIEWVIRQAYSDGTAFSDEPFSGSDPYVTIGWKVKVEYNG